VAGDTIQREDELCRAVAGLSADQWSQLDRPFRVIVFDWDGTAVMDRSEDASEVTQLLEDLLKLGVQIVVITGTNFGNVDRQFCSRISGPHKTRLYICANRGSEVFGFDTLGRPLLIYRRVATPAEEELLTKIAEDVRRTVNVRYGLDIDVIANRLNRRKIDLIPVAEWANPPKWAIGELLVATEKRLREAGVEGGIREIYQFTVERARELGLPDARITSDVKHIEVGLTDKEDSMRWVMREIVGEAGIEPSEVLIGGDEFGPIAGFEGSDYKMYGPVTSGAVFFSVGPEPNGAPEGIIHLGGGPACFRQLMARQVKLHREAKAGALSPERPLSRSLFAPTADQSWVVEELGFAPTREHEVESLLTVANGYVGTRGSLAQPLPASLPATFVAGVFAASRPPEGGLWFFAPPQLVVAPDWVPLRIIVENEEIRLDRGEMLEHWRSLDTRRGLHLRDWRHRDPSGRITRLRFIRFASLSTRRLLGQWMVVVPENYSGRLIVESIVDGELAHSGPGSRPIPLEPLLPVPGHDDDETENGVFAVRPSGSPIILAYGLHSSLEASEEGSLVSERVCEDTRIIRRLGWQGRVGRAYSVDKLVAVHTSRTEPEPVDSAKAEAASLVRAEIEQVLHEHERAWAERWDRADVKVEGPVDDQRALRFALYHLISSANPEDEHVSIGARGLTGESYKGHVFWDTEIFMLPFFIFTHPPSARALLMYRYHTLDGARHKAARLGYRGALYAWESADTGEEVTPPTVIGPDGTVIPILCGVQEQHISADVAYAVWQYWQATLDESFLLEAGAEIILETARFWSSRARLEADGRYHINEVIGPDEYHEGVDDNAYTNVMAQWNIERGLEVADLLRQRWPGRWRDLATQLKLEEPELAEWSKVKDGLVTNLDPETGLIEQFRGFFGLEYVDIKALEPRTVPVDIVLGRERTRASQVVKQADVVMLIYLLWDRFPPSVREANFRYYEPRTGHGSSLSPAVHAAVAARLGDTELAAAFFRQTAEIDLANNMGNASGGVHMAAQGGLWQAAVMGFAGMHMHEDRLDFDPHLPAAWKSLEFPLQWRGRQFRVRIAREPQTVEVLLEQGQPMLVSVQEGSPFVLQPGIRYLCTYQSGRWGPWEAAA